MSDYGGLKYSSDRAGFTPMLARPGGPKHYEEIFFFVILWAIYKSKITKIPEDIEQINITNNRVKNDKLFPCFSSFLCTEITLSFSRFLSQTHTQYRHALAHKRGDAHRNLLSVLWLPRKFINKIAEKLHDIS